jgi:hypothetical protein
MAAAVMGETPMLPTMLELGTVEMPLFEDSVAAKSGFFRSNSSIESSWNGYPLLPGQFQRSLNQLERLPLLPAATKKTTSS